MGWLDIIMKRVHPCAHPACSAHHLTLKHTAKAPCHVVQLCRNIVQTSRDSPSHVRSVQPLQKNVRTGSHTLEEDESGSRLVSMRAQLQCLDVFAYPFSSC